MQGVNSDLFICFIGLVWTKMGLLGAADFLDVCSSAAEGKEGGWSYSQRGSDIPRRLRRLSLKTANLFGLDACSAIGAELTDS